MYLCFNQSLIAVQEDQEALSSRPILDNGHREA
jgi:hypothetical protein